MKRIISIFLTLTIFCLPLFRPTVLYADFTENITLSDAVYAELALHNYLDNVSIDYFNGNDLDTIAINTGRQWIPASTVKLYVAMYLFDQVDKKIHNLDEITTIEDKNVVPTELVADALLTFQTGDVVTLRSLVTQMITQSDNTAYNVLLDTLGRENITKFVNDLGLTHTHIGSKLNLDTSQEEYEYNSPGYGINTTTAEDYTKAFILIKDNKIKGAAELFDILKHQKINTMIPFLLPKDAVVAHKTGDLEPLYHDGGIVTSPVGTYVLSMFSNLGDTNILARLSLLIYTKNYDLVGTSAPKNNNQTQLNDYPLDPLVANATENTRILGTTTIAVFQPPQITAADLGIKANDLSLGSSSANLPHVVIPADSPLHFLMDATQTIRKFSTIEPKAQAQEQISEANLKLAEAKDLQDRGKTHEAVTLFSRLQEQLMNLAKDKTIQGDATLQTQIQSISETRFALLGKDLSTTPKVQRLTLIKAIAQQAKSTVTDVQPFIPKATSATNPSQHPLIGNVIASTKNTLTIKTDGGQKITVPLSDGNIIIKQKGQQTPISGVTPVSGTNQSIQIGTTVALVGSTTDNTFIPNFILTNLPKELAAPQPVTVLKVNPKTNTMVISENGVPVQVNVSSKTVIKANDTNIPLQAITPGTVVLVRGELVVPTNKKEVRPTGLPPQTPPVTGKTDVNNQTPLSKSVGTTSKPAQTYSKTAQQSQTATSTITPTTQPKVIQSIIIQVVGNQKNNQTPGQKSGTQQKQSSENKSGNSQPPPPSLPPPQNNQQKRGK